ncbi:hypothetical protein [Bradyrhizobium sp. 192]|nr:hypothetical protein [Bradyrhizobium sp. 192]
MPAFDILSVAASGNQATSVRKDEVGVLGERREPGGIALAACEAL